MLRTRNADIIGEAGTFQRESANELAAKFKKLETDVETLRNFYKGAAADADIRSFQIGIANFKKVIEKIEAYGKYQEEIFKHDSDNHDKAKGEIQVLLNDPIMQKQVLQATNIINPDNSDNIEKGGTFDV